MDNNSNNQELRYEKIRSLFNNETNNFSFNRELFNLDYILSTHKIKSTDDNKKDLRLDMLLDSLLSSSKHNVTKIHGIFQLLYLSNIYNYGKWDLYDTEELLRCIGSGYVYVVDRTRHYPFSLENLSEIENSVKLDKIEKLIKMHKSGQIDDLNEMEDLLKMKYIMEMKDSNEMKNSIRIEDLVKLEDSLRLEKDNSYEIIVLWDSRAQDEEEPFIINSVGEFIENIRKEGAKKNDSFDDESEYKRFYRGHGDLNFQPQPSVFRGSFLENEKKLYQELLIRKTANFYNCNTVLDHLSLMQHYGLPTRLLDLTTNPLIALYFACDSSIKKNGEILIFKERTEKIKYDDSDAVKIASCMALLKETEKEDFLMSGGTDSAKLLSVIKREVGHFEDIIQEKDLSNIFFVKVNYGDNIRVESQSGVFAISANHHTFVSRMKEKRESKKRYIIPQNLKDSIRRELNG